MFLFLAGTWIVKKSIAFITLLQVRPVELFYFSIFRIDICEIIIFISIVLILLIFLIVGSVIQTQTMRNRLIQHSDKIVERECRRLGLSEQEKEALRRLSEEIKGGRHKKYLLVSDPVFFNTVVHRYLQKDTSLEALIAALRIRLGFTGFSDESTVHSTADLIAALPVYILSGRNYSFHGKVVLQEVNGVTIKTDKRNIQSIYTGENLRIFFAKKNGIFYFDTSVLALHDDIVLVKHTEDVMKLQRRKYYRKRMKEKVKIKREGEIKSPTPTLLIDLGGDGATLWNPRGLFKENDRCVLTLTLKKKEKVILNAQVMRVSHDGKYLHVRFSYMKDNVRDKIFNYLFLNKKNNEKVS